MKVKSESEVSRVRLFETPWTAAHQAPPSMGFSRQEYWSGVPSPSPVEDSPPQENTAFKFTVMTLLRTDGNLVIDLHLKMH